jgi:hypothetical protein
MTASKSDKSVTIWTLAAIAVLFGVLTIFSGGQVLFGGSASQKAAGNYVPFVVWFNFLAGFAYLAAGAGIWTHQRWAVWLSLLIAVATIIVFANFAQYISGGGEYENRTIAAMGLRSFIWISIYIFSHKEITRKQHFKRS